MKLLYFYENFLKQKLMNVYQKCMVSLEKNYEYSVLFYYMDF